VKARIEPMGAGDDMDIPMPAMTPAYRVAARRGAAMDPGTRRLAIFAGAIGGALVLLVGIWSFTGHHHAGVPVIEADRNPVRVKPANPGGMQIEGANDAILSGEAEDKGQLAPPPETPAPQALKAEEKAAAAVAPSPPLPASPAAEPPKPVAASEAKPVKVETKPGSLTEKPAAPKPAAMAGAKPAIRPTSSGVVVQLAALESEEAAKAEWRRLERRYGDMLEGKTPTFSRTEHAGKTFWRVRTGGFADTAQAVLFCQRIRAKGGGCAVASF
jgi:hypothetical protein